jgi:uncharacterized protein YndB with AHSA1/START domain
MPVTDVKKDLDALTLTITAEFGAAAERMWRLWADPRELERWWGPPSYPATFLEHELVPGSRSAYFMTGPDGTRWNGWWRIDEVEPPHRLRIEDSPGEDADSANEHEPLESMVVTIAEKDGLTTMSVQCSFSDLAGMERMVEMGMERGMVEAYGQIDALLQGPTPTSARRADASARAAAG